MPNPEAFTITDGVLVCFVDGFNIETIFCKYNFVYSSGIYSSMESVSHIKCLFHFYKTQSYTGTLTKL